MTTGLCHMTGIMSHDYGIMSHDYEIVSHDTGIMSHDYVTLSTRTCRTSLYQTLQLFVPLLAINCACLSLEHDMLVKSCSAKRSFLDPRRV